MQLERENGIPRNPFINAAAIVVADVVLGQRDARAALAELLQLVRKLAADNSICIDTEVAQSEASTGERNRALGHFMRAYGNLVNPVEAVLQVYFNQCALAMSCAQLARAGLFLAADVRDPETQQVIVNPARARRINALMLTCGHYDASGDFAFRTGLPARAAWAVGYWRSRRSGQRSRCGHQSLMTTAIR